MKAAQLRDLARAVRTTGLGRDFGHLDRGEVADWLDAHALTLERWAGPPKVYGRFVPGVALEAPSDPGPLDGLAFYCAAPSAQIARAERMIGTLALLGASCTFDWTELVRAHEGTPDADLSLGERHQYALSDLRGVGTAHLALVLTYGANAPISTSVGAAVELGAALAGPFTGEGRGDFPAGPRRVLTVGGRPIHPIFGALCDEIVDDDEDAADLAAVRWIVAWWGAR